MIVRSRLVWKLGAAVVAVLAIAIALSGYLSNLICAHFTLESARASLRFNSESIVKGIGQLMMARNNEGIQALFVQMSQGSTDYRDIRLVSHLPENRGKVKASRFSQDDRGQEVTALEMDHWSCATCHQPGIPVSDEARIVDKVVDPREGERLLSVMVPVVKDERCFSCHAGSPEILGFLNADYSLKRVDATVNERRIFIAVTVLISLVLGVVALLFMFTRLLGRPINNLIDGTKRIGADQLDFRFDAKRNDEIGALEASFNTMTTRIRAHRDELRAAMEYLRGMVENSTDIIITVTPEGLIETFNRGAEQALGYDRVEVIGKRIESLYVDPRERHRIAAILEGAGNVGNIETALQTKEGQVRNVMLTLSCLRDGQGQPIGTIGISKDITKEKRLLRELVHSQRFAAIGQAVTGIQHAIKNMLGALKGGLYLVTNGIAKENRERIRDGSAMIEEGIDQINELSRNMLNYSKEWKLQLERADLNELVTKICNLNRQDAADRGVALRCETTEGLPPVLCDSKLIHRAVTDIVVNAVDACVWKDYASGQSPEVVGETKVTAKGDVFLIEIADNGCGMDDEIKRNIFTPFFSTKKTQGTGLGLALTSRIINVHHGEIGVESEPDRGTTFRIHLPIDGPSGS